MPLPQQKRKKLGEMLIAEGLISREQLERALAEQRQHGGRIGTILRSLGFVTEDDIIKVLGKQMGIQPVMLSNIIIDPDVVKIIPETLARRYQIIPLFKKDKAVTLAMVDPLNVFAVDDIRRLTGMEIEPVVSSETEIMKAIDRFYSMTGTMEEAVRTFDERRVKQDRRTGLERRRGEMLVEDQFFIDAQGAELAFGDEGISLETVAEDAPVVKLVNTMIAQAVREGASDIHIEPDAEVLRIRYRVDGMLREVMTPPKHLQPGVVSRIKIMASLDISEKRMPQDGRIQMKVGEKEFDIRISTLPTMYGEKAVMRLLDKSSVLMGMEELGFSPGTLQKFRKIISRPYGLVLVTGPTGSGKTTTLYAALNTLNSIEKNIVTIEDPVEYQLTVVNQVQVNPKAGVTFVSGLRSILRQDPDILMVGEIRDVETATIAIQSALTGHLVFSTLHTNDSVGAVARLVDMGVEPFLIASSLIVVVAQRLVRKVCSKCKEPYIPTAELLENLGMGGRKDVIFMRGVGCQDCRQTGYAGRTGIYELMTVDEAMRNLIVNKASSQEMRNCAVKTGFIRLREEGLSVAVKGMTTPEEILRVTQEIESA
ncbi:MAG TPA: ATPase, T2SS/T4P/T4SS family [Nitrospiria bacterium]|nr:ATPase, T2SS/T4P/T4SS family [Nitrospiria bacterium]